MADIVYIKVDGRLLPPPKRGLTPVVTTVVDSARNVNGTVVGQRIGRDQYKLDNLEWAWLTAEEWAEILQAVAPFKFNVEFLDPVTNTLRTIRMYCGDRKAEPYWVDAEGKVTHYMNCRVNLIDLGEQ